jgi:hypothetical protein
VKLPENSGAHGGGGACNESNENQKYFMLLDLLGVEKALITANKEKRLQIWLALGKVA